MIVRIILLSVALLACAALVFAFIKKKIKTKTLIISIISAFLGVSVAIVAFTVFFDTHLNIKGDSEMKVNLFSIYADQGFDAYTGYTSLNDKVTVNSTVDTTKVGEYEVEYSLKFCYRDYKAVRKVRVVDNIWPTLTLKGDKHIIVSKIDMYKEIGFSASDNYDGDITSLVKTEQKSVGDSLYEITYSVSDSSGNIVTDKREIEVKDIVKPVISLSGYKTVYVILGENYAEAGYSATDDADGNITKNVAVQNTVNTSARGTYNIIYTVADAAGNTTSVTRKVVVCTKDELTANRICLTFDDGPSSSVTVQILDTLKANDVKATFFIIDYSRDKLPIIKRMINEGHTIGIHGYSHNYAKIYASDEAFMENINKLRDKLYNDTGYYTNIMRFPGGSSNTVSRNYSKGIMTRLSNRVTREGWRYFDWNITSKDAESRPLTSSQIANNVTRSLSRGRSNIVLMHDSNAKKSTAQSLQSIINYGKQNGYRFCAIDDTVPENHHGINN